MKAKDLAALAALGVAGFAAYDKFGKKSPANSGAKAGAKLGDGERDGEAGEREARMNMRDMNEGSGRRDAGGNTEKLSRQERDVPEKAVSRQERDVPEALSRQERDVPEKIVSRQERDVPDRVSSNGGRKTDIPLPAGGGKKTGYRTDTVANDGANAAVKSPSSTDGPSRYRRDDISEAPAAPAEKQFTPPGTQSAMGDFSRAMLPKQRIAAIDDKNGASSASARKTDALAVGSKANQAAYLEKQRLAQNQLNAQKLKASRQAEANQAAMEAIQAKKAAPVPRFAGKGPGLGALSGMRKGGVVKMASGGMTSSKPSSASSRGDGIAQRGKTRGQMR